MLHDESGDTGVLNLHAFFRMRDRKGRIPVRGQAEAPIQGNHARGY